MKKTILASVLACAALLGMSSTSFAAGFDIPLPNDGPRCPRLKSFDIPLPNDGPRCPRLKSFDIPLPTDGPRCPR